MTDIDIPGFENKGILYNIRESNLIEGVDSPEEDKQSLVAWEWLKDKKELNHNVVCNVHKLIMLNQLSGSDLGYYRSLTNINVRVGYTLKPSHEFVDLLMSNWLLDIDKYTPLENHIKFENIHPFVDGNGRVGRMLLWWNERKLGKEPTVIKNSEKKEYYKLFD